MSHEPPLLHHTHEALLGGWGPLDLQDFKFQRRVLFGELRVECDATLRGTSGATTAYEAPGSSGTARHEGAAVAWLYIGCAPPPAAAQRSTPPKLFQNI